MNFEFMDGPVLLLGPAHRGAGNAHATKNRTGLVECAATE